jgi:hypothetical protein
MQLNTVVLPAPFGPIRAVMAPRPASKERSCTAVLFQQVGGDRLALLQENRRLAGGDQPARLPDHDENHCQAEQQHAVADRFEVIAENLLEEIQLAHDFGAAHQQNRGNGDPDLAAHAAKYDDRQDGGGFDEGEGFRRNEALPGGEKRAGKAG